MLGVKKLFCNQKRQRFATIFAVFSIFLALFAAAIIHSLDWQYLADERRASDFKPSAQVAAIADDLQLTRRGRAAFYATQPAVLDADAFNTNCGRDGEATYMLGCYANDRIYLYNLDAETIDENGVYYDFAAEQKVTALHEFLHAAYSRLDAREQGAVCRDVKGVIAAMPELSKDLEYYTADQFCTEGFARIGSEYIGEITLPAKLQAVYARYFTPDYDLIALGRQNKAQLAELSARTAKTRETLGVEKTRLDSSISAYRSSLTRRGHRAVSAQIADYNTMVADYNSLVATYKKIAKVLDSEQ